MLEGKHEISVGMFDDMFISYLFVLNLLCSVSSFPMFCAVLRLFLLISGPGAIYAKTRHSGAYLIKGTEIMRRKDLTLRDSHVSAREAAAVLLYRAHVAVFGGIQSHQERQSHNGDAGDKRIFLPRDAYITVQTSRVEAVSADNYSCRTELNCPDVFRKTFS